MKSKPSPLSGRGARVVPSMRTGRHLVVFGLGNIGSHLVQLLARMPGVKRLTLVDFDRYEEKNLWSQDITAADVGRAKAMVQARRARRINPRLEVVPIVDRLENIPLGRLRGDVILAGLDSKQCRRVAGEIAWRLGVPWIDAGVEASQLLARVNVYGPAADQPCLECAWSERDYADQATVHPCDNGAAKTPATNSPACLGALAGSLAAIECGKILAGKTADALIGRQVLIEAGTHRHYVTTFRRNPRCRFDHATWKISPLRVAPDDLSIGAALKLEAHSDASTALAFGGMPVVKRLVCPRCGFSRRLFRLQSRLRQRERFCAKCGREMLSAGFYMKASLARADLGPGEAGLSLASLGLSAGDVISLNAGASKKYFELGAGRLPQIETPKPRNRSQL